jgi:RHS repeat-associated protein
VVGLRLADGSQYGRVFNAAGDLTRINSADGSALSMTYDGAGRLVSLTAVPGAGRLPVPDHQFAYDGLDRLVRAEAGGAVVQRKFDSLDRLIEDTFAGRMFRREYDDASGRYRLRYPDQKLEEYRWDLLGRVDEIKLVEQGSSAVGPASGAPGSLLLSVQYRGADRIGRLVHGNGVQSEWRHDLEGRLIRVEHSSGANSLGAVRYRYDLANRRRAIQNSNPVQQNSLADYDKRGRLTTFRSGFALPVMTDKLTQPEQDADVAAAVAAAAGATQSTAFVLDKSDTRTSVDGTPYTSVAGHKVVQVGPNALTYDADGARIADAPHNYVYDALGRLIRINAGAATLQYEFDPLGRRVRTLSPASDERRFYFHGHALQFEDAAGIVTAQRTAHPQLLSHSIETRAGGPLHFHANGHEDLMLVTNNAGAVAERYLYGPFGIPTILDPGGAPRSNSALAVDPTFGGMPYLPSAGLYFTPKRHYDPGTGLFLARDPFFNLVSPSPYVFAVHDPINYLDPAGDIAPLIVAGLVVGAIGAVVGVASVIARGGDYDGWDVLAAAGIGFGAGFIGAVTFGGVAAAVGGAAVTAAAGTAAATTATTGAAASLGVSVLTGIGAGAVSGLASGVFSGTARASYQWIRKGGELGDMILQGAVEEGISGTVSGAVGGGLFQGALRLGVVPSNAWAALRGASNAVSRSSILPATLGRAVLGVYGLGSAAIGFTSSYAGAVTRRLLQGETVDDAVDNAVTDGMWGAGMSVLATALHPSSWVYWRARLSQSYAQRIQDMRAGGAHHQRNVAQYPEYATPDLTQGGQLTPTPFESFYGKYIIGGNLEGEFSTYSNRQQHIALHNLWRFGQTGSPWRIPTHGPWTPAWNVHNLPADPRATNNVDKEN